MGAGPCYKGSIDLVPPKQTPSGPCLPLLSGGMGMVGGWTVMSGGLGGIEKKKSVYIGIKKETGPSRGIGAGIWWVFGAA